MLEQAIIGSLYLYDDMRREIISDITSDDFANPKAKIAFSTVEENLKLDKIAIIQKIPSSEIKQYILEAVQLAPVKSNVIITLNSFIEFASERKFNEQLQTLALAGTAEDEELEKIIVEKRNRKKAEVKATAKYLLEYDQKIDQIPTGFPLLDDYLNGGFLKGTIVAIGGRPSSGKTTKAINIVQNIAFSSNYKIAMFSLEMTSRMILDKLVSNVCNISYREAQSHRLSKAQRRDMQTAVESLQTLDIYDDIYSVEKIIANIYRNKPDFVVIDYVQIVKAEKEFKDPRIRIDYIVQKLKQCAKETGCIILILAQVNRTGKDMPRMSDLKESGGLEQDGDYIILVHRPYVVDKTNKEYKPSDTKIILDKNKFGGCTIFKYDFNGEYQRFTEIGEDSEENSSTQSIARPVNSNNDDLDFLGV